MHGPPQDARIGPRRSLAPWTGGPVGPALKRAKPRRIALSQWPYSCSRRQTCGRCAIACLRGVGPERTTFCPSCIRMLQRARICSKAMRRRIAARALVGNETRNKFQRRPRRRDTFRLITGEGFARCAVGEEISAYPSPPPIRPFSIASTMCE